MEFENGIPCKTPLFLKVLGCIAWLVALILANTPKPAETHVWIFFIILAIGIVFSMKDFTLFDEGMEVNFLWGRTFVNWDNIQSVYYDAWQTRISIKNVNPPNRFIATLVNTGFVVTSLSENYDYVMRIFEKRLGKKFFGTRSSG